MSIIIRCCSKCHKPIVDGFLACTCETIRITVISGTINACICNAPTPDFCICRLHEVSE